MFVYWRKYSDSIEVTLMLSTLHKTKFAPVVIFMAIGLFFSCRNEIAEIKAITDYNNYPIQTTYHAEYLFSENGVLKNKLIAGKMERYEEEDTSRTVVSEGFVLYVYNDDQSIAATMSATKGLYYPKQHILIAMDSVKLVSEKNQILETQILTWLQDSDKVFTDELVKVTSKQGVIYGQKGLVSNSSFTKYRLIDPTGEMYIDSKE